MTDITVTVSGKSAVWLRHEVISAYEEAADSLNGLLMDYFPARDDAAMRRALVARADLATWDDLVCQVGWLSPPGDTIALKADVDLIRRLLGTIIDGLGQGIDSYTDVFLHAMGGLNESERLEQLQTFVGKLRQLEPVEA